MIRFIILILVVYLAFTFLRTMKRIMSAFTIQYPTDDKEETKPTYWQQGEIEDADFHDIKEKNKNSESNQNK